MFGGDGQNTFHIRRATKREDLGALTEEFFEAARGREHPMFAGCRPAVLKSMPDTTRRINNPTWPDRFGPAVVTEIAKTSFQHDEQFILTMMNVRRRTVTGRRCAEAKSERAVRFLTTKLYLDRITERG